MTRLSTDHLRLVVANERRSHRTIQKILVRPYAALTAKDHEDILWHRTMVTTCRDLSS